MKKNLDSYVKVYNLIDESICDRTCKLLRDIEWNNHRFYSSEGLIDNGNEPQESHQEIETTGIIQEKIWLALKRYILEDVGFPWFPGWQGFSNLKFIKYLEGTEMSLHCDHIHSLYDGMHRGIPILTIIGLLNDDFDGGRLMMFDDIHIPLNKGDIIVFPSVFLYPHKIEKIKKGTRYSVISWCH